MAEWHVIIDDEDFPESSPESPKQKYKRPHWRWLLLSFGLIAIVLVGGYYGVQGLRTQGQYSIENDLTAFIFEEEALVANGEIDQLAALVSAGAGDQWRQAYLEVARQTYQSQGQVNPAINLINIDFDGACAVVDLSVNGLAQVRAYCLGETGWQRRPVPSTTWGDEQLRMPFPNNVTLHFAPRDQHFATALRPHLVNIFQNVHRTFEDWHRLDGIEVFIEPHDLAPPVVSNRHRKIVLNSPLLVPLSSAAPLSREIAVRFGLTQALLAKIYSPVSGTAPGIQEFYEAVQLVTAIHLALPPEAQTIFIEQWPAELGKSWPSPFSTPLAGTSAKQRQAAANLTAEYIYQQQGIRALIKLGQTTSTAKSWEKLFQNSFSQSVMVLDSEAAAFAQNDLQ